MTKSQSTTDSQHALERQLNASTFSVLEDSNTPDMFFSFGALGQIDALENQNVLVSAGTAYRNPGPNIEGKDTIHETSYRDSECLDPEVDADVNEIFNLNVPDDPETLMVDSGAYQAASYWGSIGVPTPEKRTRFPYTIQQYHEWCEQIGADIVAGMDVVCADAHDLHEEGNPWPGDYTYRMYESLENQNRQLKDYHLSDREYGFEIMPTIQGKTFEDFETFISLMPEYGLDGYDRYGIGTICDIGSNDEILEVVQYVRDQFPKAELHLFGAGLKVWKDQRIHGLFDTSDTSSWAFGAKDWENLPTLLEEYAEKVSKWSEEFAGQRDIRDF